MGKITDLKTACAAAATARNQGGRVVLGNGAFDMLHVGHLRYLQAAQKHGELLIIAINSDTSVMAAKGPLRPVVPENERAELVAAIAGVDLVTIFSEPTVTGIIEALRPDIHAKGTDYTADTVPERQVVEQYGGRIEIVGDPKDHSTTDTVATLTRRSAGGTGRGVPLVVSAPSGAGKTTLCRRLLDEISGVGFSVSHTTRPPRGQEQDGIDYHFVDDQQFDAMVSAGDFLEWAAVHDKHYGTSKAAAMGRLARGEDVLFDIDVQGGFQIARAMPDAVLLFVAPPSTDELERRLRGRETDSEEQIKKRLAAANNEMAAGRDYTYWLVNDDLEQAATQFRAVLLAERLRRQGR